MCAAVLHDRRHTDQKAMLLPLCNYLGIMLVGLIPMKKSNASSSSRDSLTSSTSSTPTISSSLESVDFNSDFDAASEDGDEPERTSQQQTPLMAESMELTRRQTIAEQSSLENAASSLSSDVDIQVTPTKVYFSFSQVQLCIFVSVVLDFAGCIFSNIGLSMAGSGLYQGAP